MKTSRVKRPRTAPPSRVVAIGGSAGSLEALERLFRALDPATGAAFIVLTHRDPDAEIVMPDILGRFTRMPVAIAAKGTALERDHVYVVPGGRRVELHGGRFVWRGAREAHQPGAIDELFQALASDRRDRAIGVVLSGMGSDGTAGLRAIREAFGLGMVQEPSTATYPEMPQSAIESRVADVVAAPELLADRIVATIALAEGRAPPPSAATYDDVLAVMRSRTGQDFTSYKTSTVQRRIERRMQVHRVQDVASYLRVLERTPDEAERLFEELLIGVTRFFREPEMYVTLKKRALPALFAGRAENRPIRAWVAGCASGEEAYSLAMVLIELAEERGRGALRLQIYATDLDKDAIARARTGIYPHAIEADVSPERLARFFVREEDGYRIKQEVRESIVFAVHNIISDPPFMRLDILSCRNVLIYLKPELQQKLLPLFFLALAPGGILVLGGSENVTAFRDAFKPVDRHAKIFVREESARHVFRHVDFPTRSRDAAATAEAPRGGAPLADVVARAIAERVAPPVVVITAKGALVYASQRTGHFFEQPAGKATTNVFTMAKHGLGVALRRAVRRALARRGTVHERGVVIVGRRRAVDLTVVPLAGPSALVGCLLVAVADAATGAATRPRSDAPRSASELARTRAQLDAVVAEMETSQEQLEATNEELQSANEELQSANEELTTSKEEMQSMNEELLALNVELQHKNEALASTNDDMRNLLDSTQIPTIFLDDELRVKRFTTQASRIANFIAGDVGRPITDIVLQLEGTDVARDAREVQRTLVSKEVQVRGKDGSAYMMRIHPYRTMDDLVHGVVVTFLDVTAFERAARKGAGGAQLRLLDDLLAVWPGAAWIEEGADGRCVALSKASADVLGYPFETLRGATRAFWKELRHPKDRTRKTGAIRLRRRNGSYAAFVESSFELSADGPGGAPIVLHLLRDAPRARRDT